MSDEPKHEKLIKAASRRTVLDDTAEAGARVYAEALLNAADKAGNAEAVLDELDEVLREVIDAHPEFAALITSPTVRAGERDRLLARVFDGRALPLVVNFLRVLNRHGRLDLLRTLASQARGIWNRRLNRRSVRIVSAVPLDDAQRASLTARLERMLNATPMLEVDTDPTLVGGMIVQSGDQVFDSSLRGQLARMRRQLIEQKTMALRGRLAQATSE